MNFIDRVLMCFLPIGKRNTYAMLKAINSATSDAFNEKPRPSKTDGLRVIKTFERVNKITFDPCNRHHLYVINAKADYEQFFRRVKLLNNPK